MRIAFLGVRVPGHLNPMTTLARRLKARGHDVVFISVLDTEPYVRAAQLPFIPYCEKEFPLGSVRQKTDQLGKLQGQAALEFAIGDIANGLEAAFRNLPQTLQQARVDGLVLDQVDSGLGLVPMHLGIPYVHVSNALHLDYSGNTPLATFDWPHETTPAASIRNQDGVRGIMQASEPLISVGRAYAKHVGLDIDWSDPMATMSKLAWLTQTPKEFDFESFHWPPQFHYTGPFHDGRGRIESNFPWDRLTGEPIIYASMGTLQNGLDSAFSTIAEAVGRRPGMQLVLSIGPTLDPKQVQSLPANSIVVSSAPQVELLRRSALCITHAGLNTTLESLAQGVPMVAIPVSMDQPGVAARIAYTKTGTYVPLQEMTAPRLSVLIKEVLSNPEYRQNANKMKQAIVQTNGLEKAVDLLEDAFKLPQQEQDPSPSER
ncbi:MAG TPA: nucleotide disphospho-sugar-binding domain-containing protein [Edaphobacter sp.]|nr:nucleotide disphospho-sugar-binding domain-containing protein [Edaphobacter sp.]